MNLDSTGGPPTVAVSLHPKAADPEVAKEAISVVQSGVGDLISYARAVDPDVVAIQVVAAGARSIPSPNVVVVEVTPFHATIQMDKPVDQRCVCSTNHECAWHDLLFQVDSDLARRRRGASIQVANNKTDEENAVANHAQAIILDAVNVAGSPATFINPNKVVKSSDPFVITTQLDPAVGLIGRVLDAARVDLAFSGERTAHGPRVLGSIFGYLVSQDQRSLPFEDLPELYQVTWLVYAEATGANYLSTLAQVAGRDKRFAAAFGDPTLHNILDRFWFGVEGRDREGTLHAIMVAGHLVRLFRHHGLLLTARQGSADQSGNTENPQPLRDQTGGALPDIDVTKTTKKNRLANAEAEAEAVRNLTDRDTGSGMGQGRRQPAPRPKRDAAQGQPGEPSTDPRDGGANPGERAMSEKVKEKAEKVGNQLDQMVTEVGNKSGQDRLDAYDQAAEAQGQIIHAMPTPGKVDQDERGQPTGAFRPTKGHYRIGTVRVLWPDVTGNYDHQTHWDAAPKDVAPELARAVNVGVKRNLHHMRLAMGANRRIGRVRSQTSGKVTSSRVARVPAGYDRPFHKTTKPAKRSYFVVIGIDVSGSAAHNWGQFPSGFVNTADLACAHARAQARMLTKLGIPFAVYGHNSAASGSIYVVKQPKDRWGPTQERILDALPREVGAANSDGQYLRFYRSVAEAFPATDRVVMYFTDGGFPAHETDHEEVMRQSDLFQRARKRRTRRTHLLCVGIGSDEPMDYGLDTVFLDPHAKVEEGITTVVAELGRRLEDPLNPEFNPRLNHDISHDAVCLIRGIRLGAGWGTPQMAGRMLDDPAWVDPSNLISGGSVNYDFPTVADRQAAGEGIGHGAFRPRGQSNMVHLGHASRSQRFLVQHLPGVRYATDLPKSMTYEDLNTSFDEFTDRVDGEPTPDVDKVVATWMGWQS